MATTTHTPDTIRVSKASADDGPRIASALAGAFLDDPVFCWVCPDDERRQRMLPDFFALFIRAMTRHDEIYVAGEGTGAALWAPPGRAAVAEEDADEFGRRLNEMSGVDAERMFAVSKLLDEHHPPGSFYFLQFVGVGPDSRGHGIGSALLAHMLERCDREGARAYLDATSPRNKRLYERHGFLAGGEYAPEGGPPMWPMWREPTTGRAGLVT
jgi:ribosomal protein S18 acetylase RimI-like enzyme